MITTLSFNDIGYQLTKSAFDNILLILVAGLAILRRTK